MRLSPPKKVTFWIAVIIAVLGLLATLVPGLGLSAVAFWLVVVAFILLAAGNLVQGF